jgi:hypothetical protein
LPTSRSRKRTASERIPDPPAYLEKQRAAYIAEVEACARACEIPKDRAELFLKLLRLTSLGRTHVDVHAELDKLAPVPDLSGLSTEQLDRILRGKTIEVEPAKRDAMKNLLSHSAHGRTGPCST